MVVEKSLLRRSKRRTLALTCALVLVAAYGGNRASCQGDPSARPAAASQSFESLDPSAKAEVALDRVRRGDVGTGIVDATSYIEWAAHVDPGRVVPVLEAYFARTGEADFRSEIASVLVSLGDTDPRFWNLILEQAEAAIASDPPSPFAIDSGSGSDQPCSSSEFRTWAEGHDLALEEACNQAAYVLPAKLLPLAQTGDPRTIPILRKALDARRWLIQTVAAHGLILSSDPDAVRLILAAIQHAAPFQAHSLADLLIESDDPRAEAVVRQYLPDVNLAEARHFRDESQQWRRSLLTRR